MISPLPPAPSRGDESDVFVEKADRFAAALPVFGDQIGRLAEQFNLGASLLAGGYAPPVAYVAGLKISLATQSVQYGPNTYAPLLTALPFTTSGDFEVAKFRLIQGVAGADLAASTGGSLVGVVDPATGAPALLADTMSRMPSRYGRIDASSFPRLYDALRRYRVGDPAQAPIVLAICASSLGNGPTLPNPATQAPGHDFIARLRTEIDPAGLINFEIRNYAANGSTVTDWEAIIASMVAAGVRPNLTYLIPGMNDFATGQYNGGQGFDGFQRVLPRVLSALQKIGSDVVLTTSVHPAVVTNPGLNSMPAGQAQVYPTPIAAPVSDTALQPPAASRYMQIDVLKNGRPITVSAIYHLGNRAIKSIAAAFGVPVIDAQQYQFEQYARQLLEVGNMAAVEALNFDAGQFNHPNLVGIAPYHRANADACAQLGQQGGQAGHSPRLNGMFGVNLPQGVGVQFGPGLPGAVMDIYPQHGDLVTPPASWKANTGPLDGYGVKSPVEAWHIDPATGSLVSLACIIGSGLGMPAFRAIDYTGRPEVRDRLRFYNLPAGSTAATYTLQDDVSGSFTLAAFNSGVAVSQRYRIEYSTHKGVITLEPTSPVQIAADTEFTIAISGLTITATVRYGGTNLHLTCNAW